MRYILAISLMFLASCSISYTEAELMKKASENLPDTLDRRFAYIYINKVNSINLNDVSGRMIFDLDLEFKNKVGRIQQNVVFSGIPKLNEGKLYLTEIDAEEIDIGLGINVAQFIDIIVDWMLKEIELVELSKTEKRIVKDIYIENKKLYIKLIKR